MFVRNRLEMPDRIYMRHLRATGLCAKGTRRYMAECYGLSNVEVASFFKDGMAVDEFKQRFGNDVLGQRAIKLYEDSL